MTIRSLFPAAWVLVPWVAGGMLAMWCFSVWSGLLYFAVTGGLGWLEWRAQRNTPHTGRVDIGRGVYRRVRR